MAVSQADILRRLEVLEQRQETVVSIGEAWSLDPTQRLLTVRITTPYGSRYLLEGEDDLNDGEALFRDCYIMETRWGRYNATQQFITTRDFDNDGNPIRDRRGEECLVITQGGIEKGISVAIPGIQTSGNYIGALLGGVESTIFSDGVAARVLPMNIRASGVFEDIGGSTLQGDMTTSHNTVSRSEVYTRPDGVLYGVTDPLIGGYKRLPLMTPDVLPIDINADGYDEIPVAGAVRLRSAYKATLLSGVDFYYFRNSADARDLTLRRDGSTTTGFDSFTHEYKITGWEGTLTGFAVTPTAQHADRISRIDVVYTKYPTASEADAQIETSGGRAEIQSGTRHILEGEDSTTLEPMPLTPGRFTVHLVVYAVRRSPVTYTFRGIIP